MDPEDKGGTQIETPGGRQTVTTINESGLYSLLFGTEVLELGAELLDVVAVRGAAEPLPELDDRVVSGRRRSGGGRRRGSRQPSCLGGHVLRPFAVVRLRCSHSRR